MSTPALVASHLTEWHGSHMLLSKDITHFIAVTRKDDSSVLIALSESSIGPATQIAKWYAQGFVAWLGPGTYTTVPIHRVRSIASEPVPRHAKRQS